jgi:hypothetical protein
VIALGRYGNVVSKFVREEVVRCRGGVGDASELLDCERTCSLRGGLGLEPPLAADADANMTAVSVDHFSYSA